MLDLHEFVHAQAPRMFAVVQELGDSEDHRVAAWGIAFEEHAAVVTEDGDSRFVLRTPESALAVFGNHPEVSARLVWLDAA
ncbi:hypothetical protein [Actinokineospora enzanensis]|uniref:hypothetical protein n=1 Tax=Actinokineospora enzanensis TaxID=155975 RepID=UPI00037AE45A|nr:hypothetical protein [Actinokineospora enzanensis]